MSAGADHHKRLGELQQLKRDTETRLADLKKRWEEERKLAGQIRELRDRLEAHAAASGKASGEGKLSAADEERCRADLATRQKELAALQGDTPLVQPVVGSQAVAEVVSAWTG